MHTYLIYVQYQAISCKHRHGIDVYIRANNEEDALNYARILPHSDDYEVRRVSVVKEIEVYEVM